MKGMTSTPVLFIWESPSRYLEVRGGGKLGYVATFGLGTGRLCFLSLYLGLGYIEFVTWHLVMMRLTGKTWSGGGRRQNEGVKNPTDVLISTNSTSM